ncbi:MAG: GntR family transcriptional regulator [Sphingomonadales bacterium]|nr:MAG: GntR family transcriptional regulator [Sphingomonadales bacterium]
MAKQAEAATHGRRAVIELREKILSGEMPGGMRLFEVPIAELLDISRTPVREALSRLTEEGLLERLPGGGFVVRRFGFADVIDAIELRGVMEGMAARLAAEHGVREDELRKIEATVLQIDSCFGERVDDVDFDAYSELNERFHHQLAGLPGSEMIRREVERAGSLPFASPSAFLPDRADIAAFRRSLRGAQEQHRAMVSAIAGREGTRAEAIAREHARTARRNLEYMLNEDPALITRVRGLALIRN